MSPVNRQYAFNRRDLPLLTTATASTTLLTTSSTQTSSSGSTTSGSTTSGSTTSDSTTSGSTTSTMSASSSGLPGLLSSTSSGLPGLLTSSSTASSSTTSSYTTPVMEIPGTLNNPFVYRSSNPRGTVFIGVGSVVVGMLLMFVLYHLFKSLSASLLAKKTVNNEKFAYQRFAANNDAAYNNGSRPPSIFFGGNTEYQGSVSKMPLINPGGRPGHTILGGSNDSSTTTSEPNYFNSSQDLTRMFISPTREVMTHSRSKSQLDVLGTLSNYSKTNLNIAPATNRHSQTFPKLYFDDDKSHSSEGFSRPNAKPRRTVPSMYLEGLIDDEDAENLGGNRDLI